MSNRRTRRWQTPSCKECQPTGHRGGAGRWRDIDVEGGAGHGEPKSQIKGCQEAYWPGFRLFLLEEDTQWPARHHVCTNKADLGVVEGDRVSSPAIKTHFVLVIRAGNLLREGKGGQEGEERV